MEVAAYKRTNGIRLARSDTRERSCKRAHIMAATVQNAVILIPPDVPAGAPPIHIKSTSISNEAEDKKLMLTVLNPHVVMAATDWKNASKSVKFGEVRKRVIVPNVSSANVAKTMSFVVREISFVFRRIKLIKSAITINPIEPASDRQQMTVLMVLLSAKFSKLLFQSENPAVQKAETLLKVLYQIALNIEKS